MADTSKSMRLIAFATSLCCLAVPAAARDGFVLREAPFAAYVERFNTMEPETLVNHVPNAQAWAWMQENVPLFECPDKAVEETYYFRWWSFRKHIKKTAAGFVVTEFLPPVKHAGVDNTISCAFGLHVAEARWLHDKALLDDYIRFWYRGNEGKAQPHFHKFSQWAADAIYQRSLVTGDRAFALDLLPDMVADYKVWESEKQTPSGLFQGLFWQFDVRDGMEESISGSRKEKHLRPTINSYMFANARAISVLARLKGDKALAREYESKAATLKRLTLKKLWDGDAQFFKVRKASGELSDAREAIGYVPWMFHLPGNGYEAAWAQLNDEQGFHAPFGLTTAERRHPSFRTRGIGTCEWDGAVWPFATSQTLMALGNVLRDYKQNVVTTRDYYEAFLQYTRSQRKDGKPYIGEYLDEKTGEWIKVKDGERSRYYNHSSYADLLISGVVGLRPRADETVELWPLLPAKTWEWFCLDDVPYRGRTLTILWDENGARYGRGAGLKIFADGELIAQSTKLKKITGRLKTARADKEKNP